MLNNVWQRMVDDEVGAHAASPTPSRVAPEYGVHMTLGTMVDDCLDEIDDASLQSALHEEPAESYSSQYSFATISDDPPTVSLAPPTATENDRQLLSVVASRGHMVMSLRQQFRERQVAEYQAGQKWNFASQPLESEGEAA